MALPELVESAAENDLENGRPADKRLLSLLRLLWRRRPPHTPGVARPVRPRKRRVWVQAVGIGVSLIALSTLAFFVYLYGLSGLSEQRAQAVSYKSFAGQLAQATAPTGPAGEGLPVAILEIPAIGISGMVVFEGTTAEVLTHGPGHVRATVLPGQYGISVIYGRTATYGGPFAHLMRLQRGEKITVITAQGASVYIVESFGTKAFPAPDPTKNRLVLEAGDSALFPTGWVQVSADLWTAPKPTPTTWPVISAQEAPLAGDPHALVPLVFWAQALVLVSLGGALAVHRWARLPALLCAVPAALALIWAVYENLSLLLPNLY